MAGLSIGDLSRSRPWLRGAVMSHKCGALARSRTHLERAIWQARDSYSAVAFVPDVETDQQRGDLLDNARILQLPAINRSHARDLHREFHRDLRGIRIIAAHDHVAIDVFVIVAVELFCRNVLERGRDRNALRNKLSRLLRSRALPHAYGAAGASAHAGSQRNRGINQNAARTNCRLQLLQQRRLTFERHSEHQQIAGSASCRIFHPGNLSICAHMFTNRLRRLSRPSSIARADNDSLSRTRPAQRQPRTRRAGTTDHHDGTAHANSGTNNDSDEMDSAGSLIFIREYFVLRSAGIRPISRINNWKSSGLVYWPAVAPASREIFSSISVPP